VCALKKSVNNLQDFFLSKPSFKVKAASCGMRGEREKIIRLTGYCDEAVFLVYWFSLPQSNGQHDFARTLITFRALNSKNC
jgi:hypothetical protein